MSREGARASGVPAELRDWMDRYGGVARGTGADALADGAFRALAHAVARRGRSRETAFALLAADALMTGAVDRHLAAGDPGACMRDLVERLAAGGRPGER